MPIKRLAWNALLGHPPLGSNVILKDSKQAVDEALGRSQLLEGKRPKVSALLVGERFWSPYLRLEFVRNGNESPSSFRDLRLIAPCR